MSAGRRDYEVLQELMGLAKHKQNADGFIFNQLRCELWSKLKG